MLKHIRRDRALILLVASICLPLVLAAPLFAQAVRPSASTSPKMVLSFEELDKLRTWRDLPRYGLQPPEQPAHKAGTNLVLLAIKATSYSKGSWVLAHGLLGAELLDVDLLERIAYRSLFLSLTQRFKLYAVTLDRDLVLLHDAVTLNPKPTRSIITKREAAIWRTAYELEARYIYDAQGNWSRNYLPDHTRPGNARLKQAVLGALSVYRELETLAFRDRTLGDAIGIAWASLDYDSVQVDDPALQRIRALQIYRDALGDALSQLRQNRQHSRHVLETLGWAMEARGLAAADGILLPEKDDELKLILRTIGKDLDAVRKRQ